MADLHETTPGVGARARGLVSSRASGARVDVRTWAPPPSLEPVVESFWRGAWDLPDDDPHTTELLGDPAVHLVFEGGQGRIVGVISYLDPAPVFEIVETTVDIGLPDLRSIEPDTRRWGDVECFTVAIDTY